MPGSFLPTVDEAGGDLARHLATAFRWRGDRVDDRLSADVTGWWRQPGLMGRLGPALAGLVAAERPTVVIGVESSGCLLGPLVALALGVGFIGVRKDPTPACDSDRWSTVRTPPDYADRQWTLGFRRNLLGPADRAVLVDDWIATGSQADATRRLVADAEATWVGATVIVDALTSAGSRHRLGVRSLLHEREL